MNQELERTSPESVGISSVDVENCIKALMHDRTEMHGFMAARHGKVFTECWWKPYGPNLVHSNHSLGKSYTATAIGILYTKGILKLEERIIDIFADEVKKWNVPIYENLEKLTVKDVLKMSNGMERNPMLDDNWVENFLKQPIVYTPGTHFMYNTSGACLLGAIVQKKSGVTLHEYLNENLFKKIGINGDDFVMLSFKDGYNAEPGTFSKTEDNLRLAMFYLNYGNWNGEQIVDEDWMRDALSIQIDTAENVGGELDCRVGYGYQLWACSMPGVFRFDGGQGQYGLIWPEKDLVVSLHEGGMAPDGQQTTLEVLYNDLLKKVVDEPLKEDPEANNELKAFEASLELPQPEANKISVSKDVFEGDYIVTEGDADPWISVSPGTYNFFSSFFEKGKKAEFTDFSLRIDDEKCEFTADGYAKFIAYFDGKYRVNYTDNVLPEVGYNCSTARYLDEKTLEITIKWVNSWFINVITFEKDGDKINITTSKDRLHEGKNRYTIHHAAAKKI